MGVCASKGPTKAEIEAENKRTKALDNKIMHKANAADGIQKLLLLGAGESGKSTLFKQMKQLYGAGFTEDERHEYISAIWTNVLESIHTLIQQTEANYGGFTSDEAKESAEASKKVVADMKTAEEQEESFVVTATEAKLFKVLLADPNFQTAIENRAKFQLVEGAPYFFENLDRVCTADYVPSDDDVLHSRVRTTGIVEERFQIQGAMFQIYDMGGQRSERKKWMNCFQSVTAVLFVCAVSGFNQVLFEDNKTNRLMESITLFKEIASLKWFQLSSIILFLNKEDVFRSKLDNGASIKTAFPEYTGADSFEESVEYITQRFQEQTDHPYVYPHVTQATNKENVQTVFEVVKDTVIRNAMHEIEM